MNELAAIRQPHDGYSWNRHQLRSPPELRRLQELRARQIESESQSYPPARYPYTPASTSSGELSERWASFTNLDYEYSNLARLAGQSPPISDSAVFPRNQASPISSCRTRNSSRDFNYDRSPRKSSRSISISAPLSCPNSSSHRLRPPHRKPPVRAKNDVSPST